MKEQQGLNRYRVLLAASILAYLAFWISFAVYQYSTFGTSYIDLGTAASALNIDIYHAGAVSGLEYLSFMTHISPFHLLLIPIFFAFNSPLTLVVVQDLFIAATAVLVFFAAKFVTGKESVSAALVFAFLLNPGIIGLTYFAFHLEAAMLFLYVLSFYLFIRGSRYFLLSYFVFLSVFDVDAIVGLTLLIGIAAYGLLYSKRPGRDSRIWARNTAKMLPAAFAITVAFLVFYLYASQSLLAAYASGSYINTPSILHIFGELQQQAGSIPNATSSFGTTYVQFAILLLVVVLLWFGPYPLIAIIPLLILISPWLAEVFVVHNTNFLFQDTQNLTYATEGSVVAAIMGLELLLNNKRRGSGSGIARGAMGFLAKASIPLVLVITAMFVGFVLYFSPAIYTYASLEHQAVANYTSWQNASDVLSVLPQNATVLAGADTALRLYRMYYLELPPDEGYSWYLPLNKTLYSFYWLNTTPEFVVFCKDCSDYGDLTGAQFNVSGYVSHDYSLYAKGGGIYIYKKTGR